MKNQDIVDTDVVQDIGADVADMVQDRLDLLVLAVLDPVPVLKEAVDLKDKVNHVCK